MDKTIAVIGAGLIGRAWAMVFARAGWAVRLTDSNADQLARARAFIAASLDEQQRYGLVADARAALARIEHAADLESAIEGADWVQENLPEKVEVKRDVFARARSSRPPGRRARQLDLGDSGIAIYRKPGRACALPGRASGQSAASGADRRAVRRAMDRAGDDRARGARIRVAWAGPDRRPARARRLCAQSPAGCAIVGGDAPGRRGLRVRRRPRQDGARRTRAALVVPGADGDDRIERTRRRSRLLRALRRFLPPAYRRPGGAGRMGCRQRGESCRCARRAALARGAGKPGPCGAIGA